MKLRHRCMTSLILTAITFCTLTATVSSAPGRYELELSGPGWNLWLDEDADWKNDTIYLPPFDISLLPSNPPTCGWDELGAVADKTVDVPGTVEEHFWGANGNSIGTAGDFRGVSWWSRTFELDAEMMSKRILLAFDSVNLRAEVYVNSQLVGYDVIGNTPFDVDITDAVQFGADNRLDIRVTDPVGNFNWNDNDVYRWGKNDVPAVHGFGGITGKVYLHAVDDIHVTDVYVENKPKVKEVELFIKLDSNRESKVNGELFVVIHDWKNPQNVIWKKSTRVTVPPEGKDVALYVKAARPKLWSIGKPNLYVASVVFCSNDGAVIDSGSRRFGFRWFDVKEKSGDKRFYLNGKRVFMFCAMTRGYWPKNGIFPTEEMARREIVAMKTFGYNTMLFHRAVGQQYITEACDEAGFLTYEEPSGYRCLPGPDDATMIWRREKLRRMVIRDRNYPSMVIYNLKNEAQRPPSEDDIINMKMVHELDPGRIITYNSDRNRDRGVPWTMRLEKDPYKLHMLPFDDTLHDHGWWDHHHWFGTAGYIDDCYENPQFFMRGVVNDPGSIARSDSLLRLDKSEIIFWGEEGQWGTMMRLQKIKEELDRTGSTGWREKELLSWYDHYDRFLDDSGFRSSFPTVDDLTMSLGRNLHYFHGRILENVRIGNVSDAYNLNGWAAPTTSEDIVSVYRYPTADPSILSHYSQPLYLAVKIRDKVLPSNSAAVADIFIVNELDLKGKHTLTVDFSEPGGSVIFSKDFDVKITGGETFGELLVEGIELPTVREAGYYRIDARLSRKGSLKAAGFDDIYIIDYLSGAALRGTGAVIDTTGTVNAFLDEALGISLPTFDPAAPDPDIIIIGPHDFSEIGRKSYRSRYVNAVMDRVANGSTLIILDQADKWAEQIMDNLYRHPSVEFKRTVNRGTDGRFFVGESPCLEGLPQSQGMNWEYQTFYKGPVWGIEMGLTGNELIVGLACENRKDIVSALSRVPFGNGQIFLSTLPIIRSLSSKEPQSAAAKKLFLNMLNLPEKGRVWKTK